MEHEFLKKCLYFNVNRLSRVITRIAEEEFAGTGLTPMYGFIIRIINAEPGISQKELAEKLYIAPSTLTRFIDKLEVKQLAQRKVQGKTVLVYPTEKGQQLNDMIVQSSKNFERRYQEVLGVEQSRQLSQSLEATSGELEK
ncbi:MarR family winged helix-turn-helix transcriptional regulator [Paenibacillus aestuarii]|uniref:MarR family winged helix-turn-helix transcriptional regulator n=1 Tax=Paenibacillus aestuarii TaxID=516965 RepID=A0ABW0K4R4_9BACL|nr:MarR family transcriptional regulator [Paenibacillus aestuarii]